MANYQAISATTQVKVGAGKLKGIFVSTTSSGTITVYDTSDADTNDPKIIQVFTPTAPSNFPLSGDDGGIFFSKGLYVVIANTITATIVYE